MRPPSPKLVHQWVFCLARRDPSLEKISTILLVDTGSSMSKAVMRLGVRARKLMGLHGLHPYTHGTDTPPVVRTSLSARDWCSHGYQGWDKAHDERIAASRVAWAYKESCAGAWDGLATTPWGTVRQKFLMVCGT